MVYDRLGLWFGERGDGDLTFEVAANTKILAHSSVVKVYLSPPFGERTHIHVPGYSEETILDFLKLAYEQLSRDVPKPSLDRLLRLFRFCRWFGSEKALRKVWALLTQLMQLDGWNANDWKKIISAIKGHKEEELYRKTVMTLLESRFGEEKAKELLAQNLRVEEDEDEVQIIGESRQQQLPSQAHAPVTDSSSQAQAAGPAQHVGSGTDCQVGQGQFATSTCRNSREQQSQIHVVVDSTRSRKPGPRPFHYVNGGTIGQIGSEQQQGPWPNPFLVSNMAPGPAPYSNMNNGVMAQALNNHKAPTVDIGPSPALEPASTPNSDIDMRQRGQNPSRPAFVYGSGYGESTVSTPTPSSTPQHSDITAPSPLDPRIKNGYRVRFQQVPPPYQLVNDANESANGGEESGNRNSSSQNQDRFRSSDERNHRKAQSQPPRTPEKINNGTTENEKDFRSRSRSRDRHRSSADSSQKSSHRHHRQRSPRSRSPDRDHHRRNRSFSRDRDRRFKRERSRSRSRSRPFKRSRSRSRSRSPFRYRPKFVKKEFKSEFRFNPRFAGRPRFPRNQRWETFLHQNRKRSPSPPLPPADTPADLLRAMKTCKECGDQTFPTRKLAIKHFRDLHRTKHCPVCYKLLPSTGNDWKEHLIAHHATGDIEEEMVECPFCQSRCKIGGIYVHMSVAHFVPLEREEAGGKEKGQSAPKQRKPKPKPVASATVTSDPAADAVYEHNFLKKKDQDEQTSASNTASTGSSSDSSSSSTEFPPQVSKPAPAPSPSNVQQKSRSSSCPKVSAKVPSNLQQARNPETKRKDAEGQKKKDTSRRVEMEEQVTRKRRPEQASRAGTSANNSGGNGNGTLPDVIPIPIALLAHIPPPPLNPSAFQPQPQFPFPQPPSLYSPAGAKQPSEKSKKAKIKNSQCPYQ